ncbi:MAG TPA: Rne/Rng family ribonuclease [Rhizomicrobium sp.]|nr:Rne/Rng family ribonuclease [Rhizomicrobium sp.]
MPKRMIIDASHREETRVVVLDGQKVEEFDFEAASKRPLKGNIYLAKVTRVEPSLQAAFVEYGGNRQGFLAFAEIHPDYYQIPIADRMALIAEREEEARRRAEEDVEAVDVTNIAPQESAAEAAAATAGDVTEANGQDSGVQSLVDDSLPEDFEEPFPDSPSPAESVEETAAMEGDGATGELESSAEEFLPEQLADQPMPDQQGDHEQPTQAKLQSVRPTQKWARRRHYKIQEVIKRRQVILVQVVKEERGNKGAALTTYLSLAGRYCVLMPNTPRGGGISRKITSATDRNRLKSAAQSLELPEGMGVIIRTAGENRTKAEIKRDYEYLLRMWDTIRELTLQSNAPACVYEEGDLVKRAIRDLYNKDISEILVEGEEGYRNAKDFMRMLMPSHAKNVKLYKDIVPLFQRYQIEAQLDAMFTPTVTLRSGGYIVINQTEALVSIDVNSGRATREHSIEETAYKTNLEAADEIARQLRLRDLAGLIVIDFIDMEDARNDRNVEKRLRDAVKNDRARVQIGRISQFGLLEMSRQRLRAGVVAGSTIPCPHCGGQGIVRSIESTALRVMRGLEEEAQRQKSSALNVRAPTSVAIYAMNKKRREIAHLETEYDLSIQFEAKDDMLAGTFEIERMGQRAPEERARPLQERAVPPSADHPERQGQPQAGAEPTQAEAQPGVQGPGKRRRRRRRGRDRDRPQQPQTEARPHTHAQPGAQSGGEWERPHRVSAPSSTAHPEPAVHAPSQETSSGRKRRRRRRGHRAGPEGAAPAASAPNPQIENGAASVAEANSEGRQTTDGPRSDFNADMPSFLPNAPSEPVWSLAVEAQSPARRREAVPPEQEPAVPPQRVLETTLPEKEIEHSQAAVKTGEPAETAAPEPPRPETLPSPPRRGWWQRPFRDRE